MKKIYWGIIDRRQVFPNLLYSKGRDAIMTCNRLNHTTHAPKDKPRFRVQRFEMVLKGEVIDAYYHVRRYMK